MRFVKTTSMHFGFESAENLQAPIMKTASRYPTSKPTLTLALLLLGLASAAHAITVFQDTYTFGGVGRNGDLNINLPARQSAGTVTSQYAPSTANDAAGRVMAIEGQSDALSPVSDALFLRTQTSPNAEVNSWSAVGPTEDFADSIAGTQWSGSYEARVTMENAIHDTFLGFGLNSIGGTPSPGGSDFFFAMRPSGAWLLWRNNAADFETGTLSNFTDQQQYSVNFSVDETGGTPLLSLTVTPLDGSSQTIATNLPLTTVEATRNFGFTSSVVSDGTDAFTDAWIDNLTISKSTSKIRDTLSDVWPATDALGRALPLHPEAGERRTDKFAGIFYFNWHATFPNTTVYDNAKLIAANPANPAWGPPGMPHYWGEPRFGYYRPNDPWILRKHAQMLVDAGVDVIIFDVTNGETYDAERESLCTEFEKIRAEGGRTPQIAVMAFANYAKSVAHLWKTLYQPGKHRDLWFQWKGKPLLLTPPEALETKEMKAFFTTRTSWAWTRGGPTGWFGDGRDKWPWLDTAPQGFGWHDAPDKAEAVPVGVAQHATSNIGRSFHAGSQPPPAGQHPEQGLYFAEQWHYALPLKPEFIFITGWNEWIAQRFLSDGTSQFLGRILPAGETFFVDVYTPEYSRDIEPMLGGHGDNYYWQMVEGIRRFKGARPVPVASAAKTIAIPGDFAQWADLRPEYLDDLHDTTPRDHAGVAGAPHYTTRTGRNDLDTMHVAHDTTHLYFHATARDALTPSSDAHWMVLFLDTDSDAKTGWLGYNFRINQTRTADTASIERWDGAAWQAVVTAKWEARDRDLHLAVPRVALGLTAASTALRFDFKWADNLPEAPDALDFLDQGDTAPNARFNYRYTSPQP